MTIDLDAYFARIGYSGPRTPTLDTLRALHTLHPDAIPFENLSPLLGQRVRLDIDSIQRKLVTARRGGYCFEHGKLFLAALEALGFKARPLAARVLWRRPQAALPPRTHMLLLVDIDGEQWIADVGFGGVTLTAPLRLVAGCAQETPHESFRLETLEGGDYLLQVKLGDEWHAMYRFDLATQGDLDFELANFFVNCHPESIFVNNLLAARVTAGARHALLNGESNTYGPEPSRRLLTDVAELREVLEMIFGIRLPDADGSVSRDELDAALARCLDADKRPAGQAPS